MKHKFYLYTTDRSYDDHAQTSFEYSTKPGDRTFVISNNVGGNLYVPFNCIDDLIKSLKKIKASK